MKLPHGFIYDPLKQTKGTLGCFARFTINSVSGLLSAFQWKIPETNETPEEAFDYFPGWKLPGGNIGFRQTFFEYQFQIFAAVFH